MKKRNEHIAHALAVYCCLEAIRNQQFIADIDLTPMRTLLRDKSTGDPGRYEKMVADAKNNLPPLDRLTKRGLITILQLFNLHDKLTCNY